MQGATSKGHSVQASLFERVNAKTTQNRALVTEAFKIVPPSPLRSGITKAPRIIAMRDRASLAPQLSSLPHWVYCHCEWDRMPGGDGKWAEEARGVSGSQCHSWFPFLASRAGETMGSPSEPPSLP